MADTDEAKGDSGCAPIIVAMIICCVVGYLWGDANGYIPHSDKANVTFPKHAWEVGEYVKCAVVKFPKAETSLDCSDLFDPGTVREMDVTLWGQTGEQVRIFVCQRTSESISCHLP
jgi:hypothetical protein